MTTVAAAVTPTKTHRGENFPVASILIQPRYREPILAFYRFARASDDIADHPSLPEEEKLARLDQMEETLLGKSDEAADARPLRRALKKHSLPSRHAQDLLTAFRMDVTKRRYESWDELMQYCAYSAMPVGRFVLEVHGESHDTWGPSDALCAALQVINHLQDCAKDYKEINRVYIPLDALSREGLTVEALAAERASPELRRCLQSLVERTAELLREAEPLAAQVRDRRLSLEIAVIQRLARRLTDVLAQRDPLSERVHLYPAEVAATAARGMAGERTRRFFAERKARQSGAGDESAAKRASGSSFYLGMRLLPRAQREAVYEIYSFCRAVDDIADDGGPRPARHAQLQQWRADIDALYAGSPPTHLRALVAPVRDFKLDRADFHAIIDGMEMDVAADIRAPDFATLDLYCDRVASAVGRLCVRVFGMSRGDGKDLAHHLGRALQLTNILRDLDEDAAIGRLYLPRETLVEHGITDFDPHAVLAHPGLNGTCAFIAARARRHFGSADAIMARWPRRIVRTPKVMAEVYKMKLDRMAERGWSAPRQPVHTDRLQLLWILARYAVI